MKILITGVNGFLGNHFLQFCDSNQFQLIGVGRGDYRGASPLGFKYYNIHLAELDAVQALMKTVQPDVVFHTAAMSKPDECHVNREAAWIANVEVTRFLKDSLWEVNSSAHFIHCSTDFIFDDGLDHAEDAIPSPPNYYGETKLAAEKLFEGEQHAYTIIRPVFIYGKQLKGVRPSFVQWVAAKVQAGEKIKIVSDQLRTPTYVGDICKAVLTIIENKQLGVYNIAGKEVISPYLLAYKVVQHLQLDASYLEKVTAATFVEPVRRAKLSGLSIQKAMEALNYQPLGIDEGIALSFS